MSDQRFKDSREEMQWWAVQGCGPEAVARFESMLAKGESVNTAAMLATQKSPGNGINDQLVMRNSGGLEKQFKGCEPMLQLYRDNYKRATGESLPADAVVYRGLAKYPGDPGCVVTHKSSLSELKNTMRERNCHVEGDFENHPFQQAPEVQSCRINDVSMSALMADYKSNPAYEKASDEELREEIIAKHTKVVTADEAMAAPRTIDAINKMVYH